MTIIACDEGVPGICSRGKGYNTVGCGSMIEGFAILRKHEMVDIIKLQVYISIMQ